MQVRQVQVGGCLPTLVVLVIVGAMVAALMTASVALVVVAAAAGLIAGVVRWARRLGGPAGGTTPEAPRRAADVTIDAEVIQPPEGVEDRPPKRLE